MWVQQEEQVALGANKRSRAPSHDEDQDQQAVADADEDHHLNLKEEEEEEEEEKTKKPRQLAVPWMTDEMAAMKSELPRFLTEYTSEDAARFDEDVARTEEWFDALRRPVTVTPRKPGVFMAPGLAYDKADEEEVVVGGVLRVTKGEIKMLRSFGAQSGYRPISERYLSNHRLITEAGADRIRTSDRLFSKLYAWSQEGAMEVLRQYDADANKGSHSPADGGGTCSGSMNDPSTRPAAADQ